MVTLEQVTKRYGEKTVLHRFSLQLPSRGIVALMGPSGCGKTTLLRLLAGLETPDAGRVRVQGHAVLLFQEDRLLPWLTVEQNLLAALPRGGGEGIPPLLQALGISGESASYPGALSGGMRRRVALARALLAPGELLLLDEPFKGLDAVTRGRAMELVAARAADRLTLLVTHDPGEAALAACCYRLEGAPPQPVRER